MTKWRRLNYKANIKCYNTPKHCFPLFLKEAQTCSCRLSIAASYWINRVFIRQKFKITAKNSHFLFLHSFHLSRHSVIFVSLIILLPSQFNLSATSCVQFISHRQAEDVTGNLWMRLANKWLLATNRTYIVKDYQFILQSYDISSSLSVDSTKGKKHASRYRVCLSYQYNLSERTGESP